MSKLNWGVLVFNCVVTGPDSPCKADLAASIRSDKRKKWATVLAISLNFPVVSECKLTYKYYSLKLCIFTWPGLVLFNNKLVDKQISMMLQLSSVCCSGSAVCCLLCARLAQLLRSLTTNEKVLGSIPSLVEG